MRSIHPLMKWKIGRKMSCLSSEKVICPLNQKNNDTRDSRSAGLLLTYFFGANRSAWQVGDRTRA